MRRNDDEDYDDDLRREAYDEARARRRRNTCLCGWPDWPGQCPGAAACPVHGTFDEEEPSP